MDSEAMASPSPRPARQAALIFIFITVVLDVLAIGMIIPILPKLVVQFQGGDTVRGAQLYGLFGTVWALMQFIFSPVLGAVSDRFGRRPVILLSNFGLGLDYILMALAPNLSWLFVGRVISGITAASISTAGAYIADVTPPEKRAAGFGMIGAAFGVGFVLGPALGGILGKESARLPFWVSAGLSLLNAMYGLFVLPESLPRERRSGFNWKRANPIGSLVLLGSNRELFGLAMVNFLRNLAHVALPSTAVLYVGYRYGWDERTVGFNLASVGLGAMIVQGGLVKPFVARFGERAMLLCGLAFGVIGFSIYGFAPTGTIFWLGVPWMALWGLSGPPAQGLMTKHVSPQQQGQLQGANGSLMGIAQLVGPGMFTLVFSASIRSGNTYVPGAPFLLAALLLSLAMMLALQFTRAEVIP